MITETAALAAVSAQADVVSPGSVAIGSVSLARYKRRSHTSRLRHCHSVGYRRSPGLWLFPLVCFSLSLPSAVVVRFGGQTFGSPVGSSSGYRSMSVVSASFCNVTGTVCRPPRGPVYGPSPGLVSPCVHTYEDQHDEQKDADHEPPIAREADVMNWPAAHYVAPTEELQSGRIHSLTIRLKLDTPIVKSPGHHLGRGS
jgi:hypothetical protein